MQQTLVAELQKQELALAKKFNIIVDKIQQKTSKVKKNVSPKHKRKNKSS